MVAVPKKKEIIYIRFIYELALKCSFDVFNCDKI